MVRKMQYQPFAHLARCLFKHPDVTMAKGDRMATLRNKEQMSAEGKSYKDMSRGYWKGYNNFQGAKVRTRARRRASASFRRAKTCVSPRRARARGRRRAKGVGRAVSVAFLPDCRALGGLTPAMLAADGRAVQGLVQQQPDLSGACIVLPSIPAGTKRGTRRSVPGRSLLLSA